MSTLTKRERMALAWKALVGVFDETSVTAAHGLLTGVFAGAAGPHPRQGTQDFLKAYSDMPWVRAAAGRVSEGCAATRWRLYVARKEDGQADTRPDIQKAPFAARAPMLKQLREAGHLDEIAEHPLLDLLTKGNTLHTGKFIRQLLHIWLDLTGDAFFVKERNAVGAPDALWPVPPHWVAETPTPLRPFFRMSYKGWRTLVPQTEVLWVSVPDPLNPYGRGSGIAQSLADEMASDEYAAKHTMAFFKNNARPDFLVWPKDGGVITTEERDRFERFWLDRQQGFWRRFKPLFSTRALEVKSFDQNFRDMQLTELRQQERDIILHVWGLPPELLGITESSNRATIQVAPFIFGRYVLLPRLEHVREYFQFRLVPEYDERLILDFDSPIPEDRDFKLNVMKSAPWVPRQNEWRELMGLTADDEEGDVRMVPMDSVPTEELLTAATQQAPGTGPSAGTPEEQPQPDLTGQPNLSILSDDDLLNLRALLEKASDHASPRPALPRRG